MKKILIIGGGLAGLSAAINLLEKGHQVEIYETTKNLGGRAKSFYYTKKDQELDNGQHILMGCYDYALEYIKKVGATDNFHFQKKLSVKFVEKGGRTHKLESVSSIYPLNLLLAVFRYNYLSFSDKLKLISFIGKLFFTKLNKLNNISVNQWLHNNSQNDNIINALWHLLAISALNGDTASIPARLFAKILKQMFFRGNKSSTIVIPSKSLSKAIIEPAEEFILNNKGKIIKGERIVGIEIDNKEVVKIKTSKKNLDFYDYIVSSVPPNVLVRLINGIDIKVLNEIEYSSIISVNIWMQNNPFEEKFYGLIKSEVHWLFNHNGFISLVISSADKYLDLTDKEILDLCNIELEKYFPKYSSELVIDYKIVKEKKATIDPNFRVEEIREKINLDINNFYICGDWTNTMLPATIESAIKSGKLTAEKIIHNISKGNYET